MKEMTTLDEIMRSLPEDRRKKVEKRAKMLIAEEMTLRDLRKARNQTHGKVRKNTCTAVYILMPRAIV